MKLFQCVLASCLVVAVVNAADETKDKTDKGKLVGVWKLTKGNPGLALFAEETITILELTNDGKVKVNSVNVFSNTNVSLIQSGTYKVDGNKLTINIDNVDLRWDMILDNVKNRSIKTTIMKLTDKDLHVKYEKFELGEFTRKK